MQRLVALTLMLLAGIMATANASPLEITIEERINTTANPTVNSDGSVVYSYMTDVTGFVTIKNKGSEDLFDVWVALNIKNTTGSYSVYENYTSSSVFIYTSSDDVPDKINKAGVFNTSNANCFIHIPVLEAGEHAVIAYDVDDSLMGIYNGAPVIIEESYDPPKVPEGIEYTWNVYFNVSLNQSWWSKTAFGSSPSLDVTVVKKVDNFGDSNWTTLNFDENSPVKTFSGTVSESSTMNVSFTVVGNYSSSEAFSSKLVGFGIAVLNFSAIDGNVSGSYVEDVFAIGNAELNVTKSGPYDSNKWYGNATIKNTASGLAYILKEVKMWATETGSFGNVISGSEQTWTTDEVLNPGDSWNTSQGSPAGISFTYSNVPIIWANATFKIIKDETSGWWFTGSKTVNGTNATYGSGIIAIEKIYVIGTYLVKVTKHAIYDNNSDQWDIYLVVENIGGQTSPTIWVYDLVPENFRINWSDGDWTSLDDNEWVNQTGMFVTNGSEADPLDGYSLGLYWQLRPLQGNSNGDGSYEDWGEISNNQSVVIHYVIKGEDGKPYKPTDIFIVGIDPMYSMNQQTAGKVTIVSGARMDSYESLMALLTGVIALGAVIAVRR